MHLVVTSIKLRSFWKFFSLANYARKIVTSLRNEPDCVAVKTTGFGKDHFTMSLWKDENSMKEWYRQGAHLDAMKHAKDIAVEIRTLNAVSEGFPKWNEAKTRLVEEGRLLTYN